MEGDDDRRLHLGSQEGLEAQRRHAVDQGAAVVAVARQPRRLAAFFDELRDGFGQRHQHMGRRREAPLPGLFHVRHAGRAGPSPGSGCGRRSRRARPCARRRSPCRARLPGTCRWPPPARRNGSGARRWAARRSCSSRRRSGPCRGARTRRPPRPAGSSTPVPVSQWISITCVMRRVACAAAVRAAARRHRLFFGMRHHGGAAAHHLRQLGGTFAVGAVVQHQHMAVARHHAWPPRPRR